jgi:hypothetical protein
VRRPDDLPAPAVLFRHGAFTVLALRHEVMFRDGSAVVLHPVAQMGGQHPFQRCLVHRGHATVFDLRDLCPELGDELPVAYQKDRPGIVFYALRSRFPNAVDFAWWAARHARLEVRPPELAASAAGVPSSVTLEPADTQALQAFLAGRPDRFRAPHERSAA